MGFKGRHYPAKEYEIAERRSKVARLLISGASYRIMAEQLDCSTSTVHKDVRVLIEQWSDEITPRDRLKWVLMQLRKLGDLEVSLTADFTKRKDNKFAHDVQTRLKIFDRILALWERRSKLLGLDAPTRHVAIEVALEPILAACPPEFREEVRQHLVGTIPDSGGALPPPRTQDAAHDTVPMG